MEKQKQYPSVKNNIVTLRFINQNKGKNNIILDILV